MPKPVVSLAQQCRAYSLWPSIISCEHRGSAASAVLVVLVRVGCCFVVFIAKRELCHPGYDPRVTNSSLVDLWGVASVQTAVWEIYSRSFVGRN